jgi:beta-lactam-binding protein with PASTA domain
VPKLTGTKLKWVRKRLKKANCTLGKVKLRGEARARSGRVIAQRPRPGKFKPPGFGVRVTLK